MHRAPVSRSLLFAALVLFVTGCETGPTEPSRTIPLSAVLAKGGVKVETVELKHTGNLRATLVKLDQTAADGTVTSPAPGGLLISLAEGASCSLTGAFALFQGSVVSLGLGKGTYCLTMSENAAIPDGATLTYNMSVEITD